MMFLFNEVIVCNDAYGLTGCMLLATGGPLLTTLSRRGNITTTFGTIFEGGRTWHEGHIHRLGTWEA
jgi:hypothetical protein